MSNQNPNRPEAAHFTPGPWAIHHGADYVMVVCAEGDRCHVTPALMYPDDVDIANAQLMAAAPELLAAMKAILKDNSYYFPIGNPWGDAGRVAIAKAEGKL